MTWVGGSVPSSQQKYDECRADAVSLEEERADDVSWLAVLPERKQVLSMSPSKDDPPVWSVPTLRSAALANGSRASVDDRPRASPGRTSSSSKPFCPTHEIGSSITAQIVVPAS